MTFNSFINEATCAKLNKQQNMAALLQNGVGVSLGPTTKNFKLPEGAAKNRYDAITKKNTAAVRVADHLSTHEVGPANLL